MLNLSRFGRQAVHRRMISLNELVQEVVDDLAPEAANRKIAWQIGELSRANCDPALMKMVFANPLSNAIKFTRPRDSAIIDVGQKLMNGETVLFVRDNGAGFDMKYAGKLFGVFQRLDKEADFRGSAWQPSSASCRSMAEESGPRPNRTRAQLSISPAKTPMPVRKSKSR